MKKATYRRPEERLNLRRNLTARLKEKEKSSRQWELTVSKGPHSFRLILNNKTSRAKGADTAIGSCNKLI